MNKKIGSYLIIQITGVTKIFIAEVVEEDPLVLKVEESGPYSRLKAGDFIIDETLSEQIQDSRKNDDVVKEFADRGRPLISGLISLGVSDGQLHEILPSSV